MDSGAKAFIFLAIVGLLIVMFTAITSMNNRHKEIMKYIEMGMCEKQGVWEKCK